MTDPAAPWWLHAVCYQVYVRSFADADGDGVGDLPGITSRLDYLAGLGVDALWITPFYPSPQHDHGYDVADYTDVEPLFGSLADADALLDRAHRLGLKVIVDLVPNHTSDEHEWFQQALAAEPGSRERERYLFRRGRGDDAEFPPNNWVSEFGGPAWTRVGDTDQWYLHLFDSTQPDLNWRHPDVHRLFEGVLRFWLDRGVDGFRIDVAHGLFKRATLPDRTISREELVAGIEHTDEGSMPVISPVGDPSWDQPEVHGVYRRWRQILDEYGERVAVAEAWAATDEATARYVRPGELHQTFNFTWLMADWDAEQFSRVIRDSLATVGGVGALPTWVLSNHDVIRHVTRYGGGDLGLARGRAAVLTMLGLPGSAYLYQGEELGLEQAEVPPEQRQDPAWLRTGEVGRDGCRVPIPWSGDAPPYGFGPGDGQPWLPQPSTWAALTAEAQTGDPDSTLEFYRRALRLRHELSDLPDEIAAIEVDGGLLRVVRGDLTLLLNAGEQPVPLPGGEVLIASASLPEDGTLPANTAAWVR